MHHLCRDHSSRGAVGRKALRRDCSGRPRRRRLDRTASSGVARCPVRNFGGDGGRAPCGSVQVAHGGCGRDGLLCWARHFLAGDASRVPSQSGRGGVARGPRDSVLRELSWLCVPCGEVCGARAAIHVKRQVTDGHHGQAGPRRFVPAAGMQLAS
eukprot:Amastigsp_a510271_99.p5 type:complete len:155 gc:universal Amastigsp_a510271_99:294-758(+)